MARSRYHAVVIEERDAEAAGFAAGESIRRIHVSVAEVVERHAVGQQALADQIVERLPKGQEKFVDDADFVYFYHLDSFYRVPRAEYERIFAAYKKATDLEHDEVVALGGLLQPTAGRRPPPR